MNASMSVTNAVCFGKKSIRQDDADALNNAMDTIVHSCSPGSRYFVNNFR